MNDTLENFKQQHIINYRNAILENIKNNSNVLADDDIMSLLQKPPLDSMDLIKTKFLDLAKKNHIILNTNELDKILCSYRIEVIKCLKKIKKERIDDLSAIVNANKLEKENDVIKLNKKDFSVVNKKIKKIIKDQLILAETKIIESNFEKLFNDETLVDIRKKISDDVSKYLLGSYQRQLLENVDFKILVKDTTLINGIKEQGERYLFTLKNSRIFND